MKKQEGARPDIRAVIVDDEMHAARELQSLLVQKGDVKVEAMISEPEEAVQEILRICPDILFLDIQMPGKNGFEILRDISEAGFEPPVIFVTAFEQYAIEAIKHAAFDYILKPVEKQELYQALFRYAITHARTDVAQSYRELLAKAGQHDVIRLPTEAGYSTLSLDDIVFIRSDYHFTSVFTGKERCQTIITNIGSVEERLPAKQFLRITKDTIINTDYLLKVDRLNRQCVLEKNGERFTFRPTLTRMRQLQRLLRG